MCCNVSLKCKVLVIATGYICFYILSVGLQIFMISNQKVEKMIYKNRDIIFYNNIEFRFFYYIIVCVITLCVCGLLTCIIFILGVLKKNKFLILPFMIFSETILVCLIISELICDIIQPLYGLFLLFFIPPIVYTVVRTRAFYHEISKGTSLSFKSNIEEVPTRKEKGTQISTILKKY